MSVHLTLLAEITSPQTKDQKLPAGSSRKFLSNKLSLPRHVTASLAVTPTPPPIKTEEPEIPVAGYRPADVGHLEVQVGVTKFMLAYLNRGTLNGNQILLPESVATLTETTPIDGRGLGWYIGESKIGIAILANGTDLDRGGLADLVRSLYS